MGRPFVQYVQDDTVPKFVCAACKLDLASAEALVWAGYMGAQQPAYLFRSTLNLEPHGRRRQEHLSTGAYTLVDVKCSGCCSQLGWRYLAAKNPSQRYKEGGTLLQQGKLARIQCSAEEEADGAETGALVESAVGARC